VNKAEAKQALEDGKRLTHRHFSKDEWVEKAKYRVARYVFEDGCITKINEFWNHRVHENWNSDWEIIEEKTEPKPVLSVKGTHVWRNNQWERIGSLSNKPKKLRRKSIAEKKARKLNH
jgi:hypothetical protein